MDSAWRSRIGRQSYGFFRQIAGPFPICAYDQWLCRDETGNAGIGGGGVRQKLCRRLEDLEKTASAASARRAASNGGSAAFIEEVRAILAENGFQPEPKESLAATFARFLGISLRQLDQELMDRAHGRRATG